MIMVPIILLVVMFAIAVGFGAIAISAYVAGAAFSSSGKVLSSISLKIGLLLGGAAVFALCWSSLEISAKPPIEKFVEISLFVSACLLAASIAMIVAAVFLRSFQMLYSRFLGETGPRTWMLGLMMLFGLFLGWVVTENIGTLLQSWTHSEPQQEIRMSFTSTPTHCIWSPDYVLYDSPFSMKRDRILVLHRGDKVQLSPNVVLASDLSMQKFLVEQNGRSFEAYGHSGSVVPIDVFDGCED